MHRRFFRPWSVAAHSPWLKTAAICIAAFSWANHIEAASDLPPQIGWDAGRVETGRGAALSGAELAVSSSLSGLFSNPANMAANRVYHAGAMASIWPEASRQSYTAAIVDSNTSSTGIAGGVSGTWMIQDNDGINRSGTDLRLAVAFPFSQKFRVGGGLKYISIRENGNGPLGWSPASSGTPGQSVIKDIGVDVGLTLQPVSAFSLGLVGYNLNVAGNGLLPMLAGGGIGGGTELFTLEADILADFSTWEKTKLRVMGGGELLVADHFPIRVGYRYDEGPKLQWLSAGAGYTDKALGLEFGLRRTIVGVAATAVVFSFVYHVDSAGSGSTTTDVY
jgi:opacity protein-like surface antigen